ncbi:MAG: LysR family transcriptional regulator [Clostridiales bacterium]|nr:LysR family transcriptional regulator [Clostridiales bacterium]
MNTESMRFFYLIAKAGSISKVAKQEHISQSALSQQLQKLEIDLGKKLLERSNKGVALTKTGEVVLLYAKNILRTYDEMLTEIENNDKENITLKIEACPSIADYALPCTLIEAKRENPYLKYELLTSFSDEIITDVENNICDIGFSYKSHFEMKGNIDVLSTETGVNRIVLIGLNDSEVPDSMSVDQLLNACIITFTSRSEITNNLTRNLKSLGYSKSSLNCKLEVEGIEGAKMLVARKYGIAFLPYISVKEELYKKQFKEITVPDFDMDLEVALIFKKNPSNHVKAFVKWFAEKGSNSFC